MTIPPVDFLLVCSEKALRDFELNRLNLAANLRKELLVIEDARRQAESEALLARWLLDYRAAMLSAGRRQESQQSFEFKSAAALPPAAVSKEENHGPKSAHSRANRKERIAS